MTFPLDQMRALNEPVVRVVVAATQGSVPREVGASMLVSASEVSGTIGGGALEFEAIERARGVLHSCVDRVDRLPLGPGLGQCCGGAVTLLTEYWDQARLKDVQTVVARPLPGQSLTVPLSVSRILMRARNASERPRPALRDGWIIEPVQYAERDIWVWGAGHVGRALVNVLAEVPGLKITWIDTDQSRFPHTVPSRVETLIASNPAELVTLASARCEHFVLTYSHALDLEICHRILGGAFRSLGLIGSATKKARFRKRLAGLGHPQAQIDHVECPIGDPSLGKHPQAIALGVAVSIVAKELGGAGSMEQQA